MNQNSRRGAELTCLRQIHLLHRRPDLQSVPRVLNLFRSLSDSPRRYIGHTMEEEGIIGPSIPHKPVHCINLIKHEVTRNWFGNATNHVLSSRLLTGV